MLNTNIQQVFLLYHNFVFAFHGYRHYPIGVLFDLHASNSVLPWSITVHFKVRADHKFIVLISLSAPIKFVSRSMKFC